MAQTIVCKVHEAHPFPFHGLKHSMVVKLQLILHTITEFLKDLNVLSHLFTQCFTLSRPGCLHIHHILFFLFLMFMISPAKFNLNRYRCAWGLSTLGWLQGSMAPEWCCAMQGQDTSD